MCCLRLRLAPAVDHPKARDRAAILIRAADRAAETGVPNLAVDQNLLDPALLFLGRRLQEIAGAGIELPVLKLKTSRTGRIKDINQTGPHGRSEVLFGYCADGLEVLAANAERSVIGSSRVFA
jgi:hypothetical protein